MGEQGAEGGIPSLGLSHLAVTRTFEELFELERDRLLRALYFVTGNRADAEELLQDAFAAVWERWDLVSGMENPSGYLYRTATNGFRMRYRRAAAFARRAIGGADRAPGFDDVEVREDVRRALARLTPRQRTALVLTDLLEFTASEAAEIMRVGPSTVRSLSARARAALRSSMGDEDG